MSMVWGAGDRQYTGLHDRKRTEEYPKGQEVYEGDIVKQHVEVLTPDGYDDGESIEIDITGEVVVLPSQGVCLKNYLHDDVDTDEPSYIVKGYKNVRSYRAEVIGNKFEDPELLND